MKTYNYYILKTNLQIQLYPPTLFMVFCNFEINIYDFSILI